MLSYWQDWTTRDFAAVDAERDIALMPVAAIEQHGPHLPVSVDADICAGVIAAAGRYLPGDFRVVALPLLTVGKSNEHRDFPGTLTISAETLLRMWTDVATSALRSGFRKLVVLNSHGGQPQLVELLVRELRVEHGALAVSASTYGFGLPPGLYDERERRHGIHAGAVETAMMMHLRPEQVRHDAIADFPSVGEAMEAEYEQLRLEGPVGIGWMTQDINPHGAAGDARLATPQDGALCLDHAARGLAQLLAEVSRHPLPGGR
jgi:creatinine amidohydrolase